ncbi:MAG: hypothetical protein ACTS4U_00505 [Candidatus Hodgkinia cicadicola]
MAKVMGSCQVPRQRVQELGVRMDEILAKTSLKGPYGGFNGGRGFLWQKLLYTWRLWF